MDNVTFWISLVGVAAFLIVAVALVILWRKGFLSADALKALGDLVDGVFFPEEGPIGTLVYYARLAVRAVEQLVRSGQLDVSGGDKDNIRKDTALEIVKEYAATAGSELSAAEVETVKTIIEAEVYELKHEPPVTPPAES